MNNKQTIPFRVSQLICENFLTKEYIKDKEIKLHFTYTFGVNVQERMVRLKVVYVYAQSDDEKLYMAYTTVFVVEPEAFAKMLHDNSFTIEKGFAQYLATINVGAARGEIHARCELQNSSFKDVVLPPINLIEIIKSDIVIELTR